MFLNNWIYKFPGREDVIEQITKSPDEDPDEEEDEKTTPRIVAQPQTQNTNKAIIAIISVMAIAIILIGIVFIVRRVVKRTNERLPNPLVTYIPGIRLIAPVARVVNRKIVNGQSVYSKTCK